MRAGWRDASRWLLLALAGGLQAASLAGPWGGEPVAVWQLISLCGLLVGLHTAESPQRAFVTGWVFATSWLAGTFWWLFISMHTYGGLPVVLACAAVVALAATLGLYYGLAGRLFWRWRNAPVAVQVGVFAAAWTLAEWARGTWFTGFPWGAGGYAHVDSLAALAPWVGVYGMGAVSAALSVVLVACLRESSGRRAGTGRRWPALWVCGVGVLGLIWMVFPTIGIRVAQAVPSHTVSNGRLPVVLLQGNIPQDEKFEFGSGVPLALEWYGAQIRAALAPAGASPSLVVAPETAIPLLPQEMEPSYWRELLGAVAGSQSALLLGLPLGDAETGYTNSVAGWVPTDLAMHRYDKHHLVPFGEFIPPLFRWFTEMMHIPLGDFNRGGLGQTSLAWAGQRIAPHICYEDLFGEELAVSFREPTQAPTVLVNVSNIGWFGDSVAIDQHRQIARLRAMELQRPMLRATNTGATVAIDHRGQVTHELPRLQRGVLQAEVEGRTGLTPYARWVGAYGLWPLVGLCIAFLALARRWRPVRD